MGMRNLGKLVAMLNPLDQSATQQILKSSGKGFMNRAMSLGRAGMGQITSGGYFQGKTLRHGARRGFFSGRTGQALGKRADIATARKSVGAISAGWVGLNAMAPDSPITHLGNLGMGAAGVAALGQGPIRKNWPGMEKKLYWGAGGLGAASLLGVV